MPALITFGRILFAVLFVYTGATKLFAIQATSDFIAAKVAIPAIVAPYMAQLEGLTGMTTPQMLAIGVGAFFAVVVEVCAKPGAPPAEAVSVDAHMPAHRHGMNYAAKVERVSETRFRAFSTCRAPGNS